MSEKQQLELFNTIYYENLSTDRFSAVTPYLETEQHSTIKAATKQQSNKLLVISY